MLNYKSEIPPERLDSYKKIEATRQALQRGEASKETLAYARFLTAVENDATISGGKFKRCVPDRDDEIRRRWPFLKDVIDA